MQKINKNVVELSIMGKPAAPISGLKKRKLHRKKCYKIYINDSRRM